MNATPSSSQPAPMRTDRGDLPSPMRTKTVERDIPVRSFTTGPRTVLIAMGRLLPSRSLRPKKTYSRVAGAPVVPPVLRRPRPPERHAEQRGSPARGEFIEGPYRRPQPPRRAGEHVRSDRSGHGLAPAPAANPGGHPGIRQTAVAAARHSVEPCTPALMDYRSGHRCGPGTVRGFQGRCDVGLAIENRPLVVGTASPVAVSYPERCLYGSGPPDKGGRWSTERSEQTKPRRRAALGRHRGVPSPQGGGGPDTAERRRRPARSHPGRTARRPHVPIAVGAGSSGARSHDADRRKGGCAPVDQSAGHRADHLSGSSPSDDR